MSGLKRPGDADGPPTDTHYWCVTCRRAWPASDWLASNWSCPSGNQTADEPHPHVAWKHIAAATGVNSPDELEDHGDS